MSGRTRVRLLGAFTLLRDLQARERKRLLAEMVQVKGLMPLLMKPRNKQRWTREDRAELRAHFRRLSELSPYLVVVVLPGAPLTLPLMAWWLDRRRQNRKDDRRDAVPTNPA
jgi:hypothetical protein